MTPEKIKALLREAYLYPRATMPEGLVPDLADALKDALGKLAAISRQVEALDAEWRGATEAEYATVEKLRVERPTAMSVRHFHDGRAETFRRCADALQRLREGIKGA